MKKCFTFSNYQDCRTVAKFIQAVVPSTVHTQLSNAITVAEKDYTAAIIEGKKVVKANNIPCNWVDASGNEVPLNLVPFMRMHLDTYDFIPPNCLSATAVQSILYLTNFCESSLKRNVFTQVRCNGEIVFLVEQPISAHEHLEMLDHIKEYCSCLQHDTGNDIIITDYFGDVISK